MQTFLPTADFKEVSLIIDPLRLGNQIWRECLTLYRGKWPNHPACKMWAGHEFWLAMYSRELARGAITRRLYNPGTAKKWFDLWTIECVKLKDSGASLEKPSWLGDERVHSSHRANLLRKDSVYYSKFNWTETPVEGYYWPVN